MIERTSPAGGPTGRSSAIVRAYYTNAFLAGVARDSIAMFRDFEQHTGRDSGFRQTGLLVLHPPEDEATVREVVPRLTEQGIPTDLLEPQQVDGRVAGVRPGRDRDRRVRTRRGVRRPAC